MTTVDVVCYKYKPLKTGELPLKIRVCKDRKTRYINLGVSTKAEYWDFEKNQPKSNCPDREMLEKLIANKISEVKSKIVELKSEDKEFSASTLVEKVSHPTNTITVGELFKQHIHCLEEEKRTGYRLSIQQTYNSLIKFNKHLDIPFSEMDCSWLRRYETWLRKQSKSENTIGIRFRNIRLIFNLAINMRLLKPENYPFKQLKVSKLHQETAKRALTKKEILSVVNYNITGKDFYCKLAVHLFTFSYFMGGINFVDMAYLTGKNIVNNRLIYNRRKTSKLINLPMQERAFVVLKEYKKSNEPYLFPILSSKHKTEQQRLNRLHKVITKVNKVLKSIGEELQIPIKLTTYVARHSYATVLKRAGVATSIISESLGHSSEKVTQIYLDGFENSQIDKAMENL
ncbi:site-specific integrase [uncultured Alistipes sp.]|uniref:site-specific integrase n=1 Tax=uncultured Alistipes sp. TaxID=538949 RepID=UPI002601CF1D|nr:site-specific integrase [uncultured Alistipes sp.]